MNPGKPMAARRPALRRSAKQSCTASRYHSGGFSLVELLVATAISLFLLLALVLAYSSAKSSFVHANNTVRLSEDAAFALEIMAHDLRMAGFAGCNGTSVTSVSPGVFAYVPNLDLLTGHELGANTPNPFSLAAGMPDDLLPLFTARNAIWGFDATDSAARAALGPASTNYTISTVTPMLYVAGGSTQALQLSTAMASTASVVNIAADTYKWANNSTPPLFVIADCKGSELFRASKIDVSASTVSIAHEYPANALSSLTKIYGSDAIITPLISSVYFLATRKPRMDGDTASLYRRHFNGSTKTVEEIIPNVEAFTLQYGVDSSPGTPSYLADTYLSTAAAVADWSRVVSLRLGLILASEDKGQSVEPVTSVDWLDGTYTVPPERRADRRLYRAYSTTVALRNRMGL